jgi:sialate O-acetylesterase
MLREAQTLALRLPNTGMAVTHDIGEWNDIHPLNKLDVGQRLALWAEKTAYGDAQIICSGPLFESMEIKERQVIISFTNTGSGLTTVNGQALTGFAIAGPDKKFVWANARIEKDKIIVWKDSITGPVAVRYAWANNPERANLYNKEGLPASLFRTDDW